MSNLTRTQRAALADLEARGELFAAERRGHRADPTAGHRYSTTTLQALVDAGHATVWSGDADSHVSHVYAGVKVKLATPADIEREEHVKAAREADALEVSCPTCNVMDGRSCRTPKWLITFPHIARERAAKSAAYTTPAETTTIAELAKEFDAQPHEIAATLDLGRNYDENAAISPDSAEWMREALTIAAAQGADLREETLSPVEEVHSTHIAPLTIPAATFVDVVEHAMTGEPMVYAHCGCGMEYELDPDTGVLTYWHDAVGQESSTTLSSPDAWITFIEVGHADCESDDDVDDVEPIYADPTAPAFSQAVNAYASTVSPSAAEIMAEIPPAEEVNADVIAAFASQGMAWPNVRPSHLAEAIAVVRMQLEILENARPLEDLLAADFHLIDTVRIVSALCNLIDGGEKR